MAKDLLVARSITCNTVSRPRESVDLPAGAVVRKTDKDGQYLVVSPDTHADKIVQIDLKQHPNSIKVKPSVVVSQELYKQISNRLRDAIARYTDLPLIKLNNMKVIRDLGPVTEWAGIDSPAWLHKINAEMVTHPSLVVEPFLKNNERHLGLVYHHMH